MKKEERKHRLALSLVLGGIVFCILFFSVLLSVVLGYMMIRSGVIARITPRMLSPTNTIIMMAVNSLLIGIFFAAVFSRYPLRPVNKIISQMNRLASGDFKARLDFDTIAGKHPTVREVTESFNKMAEELEHTEMLRSDFINNFSHEFKTPIVSIAGFAKLLKRGNLTEEQKAEYISIIEEESMRLSAMATNVLNLTKIENQTILTDVTQFNVSEQIRGAILLLEGKWAKKNIEWNLAFPEYTIMANEELLNHVWRNLLDNAIKFSPAYAPIEVTAQETDGVLSVTVRNTGPTIPPEKLTKIFNKFYQADESHASEGNGIGLALVKQIISLHGGEVSVTSEKQVTSFTVTLPMKR